MPVLIGRHVVLRQIVASDFPNLVTWSRDAEINRLIDGNYPETIEECPEWFRRLQSSRHAVRFGIALALDDVRKQMGAELNAMADELPLIGDTELDHITWRSGEAELRIRIGEKHLWNRGYGSDTVRILLEHAFTTMKLRRIYLRVYRFNTRAIRCYEKCGFKKEGRLVRPTSSGELQEVILMRILQDEFQRRSASAARALRDAI